MKKLYKLLLISAVLFTACGEKDVQEEPDYSNKEAKSEESLESSSAEILTPTQALDRIETAPEGPFSMLYTTVVGDTTTTEDFIYYSDEMYYYKSVNSVFSVEVYCGYDGKYSLYLDQYTEEPGTTGIGQEECDGILVDLGLVDGAASTINTYDLGSTKFDKIEGGYYISGDSDSTTQIKLKTDGSYYASEKTLTTNDNYKESMVIEVLEPLED